MCGIAGLINVGNPSTLARMTSIQQHRGPDDEGIWHRRMPDGTWLGLGSRRLSIQDLSSEGHMPMSNPRKDLWITYNGEIYNFAVLRRELEGKGYHFRSGTDTEVLLYLYEEEGKNCVNRLEGMFAFAICDLRSRERPVLFMARDHFGVKPLYYWQGPGCLAFASELKALLEVEGIEAKLRYPLLERYLNFLWVPEADTLFSGIFKLLPGHRATFIAGRLEMEEYWDLPVPEAGKCFPRSESDLAEEARSLFQQAVKSQMISDVPIGAFLSAGLDSSSIVALMAAESPEPLKTYTITFPDSYRIGEVTLDDPAVARQVSNKFRTDHHELVVEPDVVGLLPKLVWHMDDPVADPATIMSYLVSQAASESVTVLLSGVGGDELFGGYRKYCAHYWAEYYRKMPVFFRNSLIEPIALTLPSFRGSRTKGWIRLLKKSLRSGSLSPEDAFLMNSTYLGNEQRQQLYTSELARELENEDGWGVHRDYFRKVKHADFLNQMLYVDFKTFMVSLNLNYNDKMSMASSVEVRVPFLDRRLVEFAMQEVDPRSKVKGTLRPVTKHIFRRAMEPILPPKVLRQRKAGFGAPLDDWIHKDLAEMVGDLLGPSSIKKRGLFKPEAVDRIIEEHRRGKNDWSFQIWQLLTLELWMKAYIDV